MCLLMYICIFVVSQVSGVWVTPYSDVPLVIVTLEELRAPSRSPSAEFTLLLLLLLLNI